MSTEEDVELKDLLMQTLENNGVLAKIKAELRASIYLTFEEENSMQNKSPLFNESLLTCLKTEDGQLMFLLVYELLKHFNLEYTLSVFESESNMNAYCTFNNRLQLIQELNLNSFNNDAHQPILLTLLKTVRNLNQTINDKTYDKSTNFNQTFEKINYSSVTEDNTHSQSQDDVSEISISNVLKPITSILTTKKSINSDKCDKLVEPNLNSSSEETDSSKDSSQDSVSQPTDCLSDNNEKNRELVKEISANESHCLIDFDKSIRINNITESSVNNIKHSLPEDKSPAKNNFHVQSVEKSKHINSLSSLHDLPPLILNKSRTVDTELLPSLYSKDSLLEESMENYEEDFVSDNEFNFINKNLPLNKSEPNKSKLVPIGSKQVKSVSNLNIELENNGKPDALVNANNIESLNNKVESVKLANVETKSSPESSIAEEISFEECESDSKAASGL